MAISSKRAPIAPPTIAHLRGQGLKGARVFCGSIYCGRMIVIPFEDIGLSDSTPFPAIKTHRRWTCQRCGSREVSVMPDWRDPREIHAEQMSSRSVT